jgi:hypothetical protein
MTREEEHRTDQEVAAHPTIKKSAKKTDCLNRPSSRVPLSRSLTSWSHRRTDTQQTGAFTQRRSLAFGTTDTNGCSEGCDRYVSTGIIPANGQLSPSSLGRLFALPYEQPTNTGTVAEDKAFR